MVLLIHLREVDRGGKAEDLGYLGKGQVRVLREDSGDHLPFAVVVLLGQLRQVDIGMVGGYVWISSASSLLSSPKPSKAGFKAYSHNHFLHFGFKH